MASKSDKHPGQTTDGKATSNASPTSPQTPIAATRAYRLLITGKPALDQCDNRVITARYTVFTFLPVAILEQFRRFANLYFLCIGMIMFIGTYTAFFESAISPWTTLGPLAIVISISLLVEGNSDFKRHRNDKETNNTNCVILRRADEIENEWQSSKQKGNRPERDETILSGKDVLVNINKSLGQPYSDPSKSTIDPNAVNIAIAFQKIKRKEIRQGHFVLVKNREMVPADIVLLASSNDQGCAYIETSSIDGETNLKLRTTPTLPKEVSQGLRGSVGKSSMMESIKEEKKGEEEEAVLETIDVAVKRITRMSALGQPAGVSAVLHPSVFTRNRATIAAALAEKKANRDASMFNRFRFDQSKFETSIDWEGDSPPPLNPNTHYVATLTSEPPNASVHTFSGKLTFPPFGPDNTSPCAEIPLGAENILLRGAVIRNTEWVIGLACFTGSDTKLVQNSFKTPSKFSQLDVLMNKTVIVVLFCMILIISYMATSAVYANDNEFEALFYVGYNKNTTEQWPYLPADIRPPKWESRPQNWIQFFLLYTTLMSNFIPLSLYVTVELVTWCMLYFVYADVEMYDDRSNTRALARSTIISDLGRIQYIFSDKTGTLTQNVMRFKRCSVDGIIFGAPIERARPAPDENKEKQRTAANEPNALRSEEALTRPNRSKDADDAPSPFLPLRQLLVGKLPKPRIYDFSLQHESEAVESELSSDKKLTFNAEMFLRVMSLCHTVVVEQDIEKKTTIDAGMSTISSSSNAKSLTNIAKSIFRSNRKRADSSGVASPLASVAEEESVDPNSIGKKNPTLNSVLSNMNRSRVNSVGSVGQGNRDIYAKNDDGAPLGYAYQAESPDEGALVSAASTPFGFQVIGRDSNGIKLRCTVPTHFQDPTVSQKLKDKSTTLSRLACETVSSHISPSEKRSINGSQNIADFVFSVNGSCAEPREETWAILAVNKFDSDRKRMSILLRSPPELGNLPILFCKGADSAMIDPDVCANYHLLQAHEPAKLSQRLSRTGDASALSTLAEYDDDDDDDVNLDETQMAHMLGLQVHLGEFAKEGLRTLVLGMKVLTERECSEWIDLYKAASTSMKKRSELLTEVAKKIETGLHIVGATAIEDKLQNNVPETIATLAKAGIKLWVLTGDKRETAVEIGYSTRVLTPKMHLTEVPDQGKHHVRTQLAMEFIRLTKIGRLPIYQNAVLQGDMADMKFRDKMELHLENLLFRLGKYRRGLDRLRLQVGLFFFRLFGWIESVELRERNLGSLLEAEALIVPNVERRRKVRARAEKTIRKWLQSDEGEEYRRGNQDQHLSRSREDMELSLTTDETPVVFTRASSARLTLDDMANSAELTSTELRKLSLAHLTATEAASNRVNKKDRPLVDEDTLSLESFVPTAKGDLRGDFDKKKRTILERLFAIDKDVRKGRLTKHLTKQRLQAIREAASRPLASTNMSERSVDLATNVNASRALVIEGAALKHLLGEPDFEEILFAVASNCEAVIACRVSPKQKAELVNLVRRNVKPEPITLAIGDGANDVGMIQEAHVGIGISGKEGKQAVNASDFSIAQFRFLESLILIHGRWDFFRLSIVVMFSFYKNTVMAGIITIYGGETVYSGTPLFDEWVIAMLNFVAAWPIIMTGLFDRCLSKDYVLKHPEVYKATRENELITFRTLLRWISLVFLHMCILYYFTVPQQAYGGNITPAFSGLMRNNDSEWPGDGEGGDLQSVGTVTYSCMIILFAYKVLFETRSLVHGKWPAFTCRKGVGEGFASRLAYTWIGVTYLSILFYFFAISMYSLVGRRGASAFSNFVSVTSHVMTTRSLSWMLIAFVPFMGIVFDVSLKVFSNMFYPTQTQIHLEIEAYSKIAKRLRGEIVSNSRKSATDRV